MAEESIVPKPMMVLGDALRPISRMMAPRIRRIPSRNEAIYPITTGGYGQEPTNWNADVVGSPCVH